MIARSDCGSKTGPSWVAEVSTMSRNLPINSSAEGALRPSRSAWRDERCGAPAHAACHSPGEIEASLEEANVRACTCLSGLLTITDYYKL